jgi:hypothetical protein
LINEAVKAGEVSSDLFERVVALQEESSSLQVQIEQYGSEPPESTYKDELLRYTGMLNDVITQWMNDEINLGFAPEFLKGECGTLPDLLDEMRAHLQTEGLDAATIDELISEIENN